LCIPALEKVITKSWARAEEVLRENLKEFPDCDEEFITKFLHAKLQQEFDKVSTNGAVARAFLGDLGQAFPRFDLTSLSRISRGLVASVSFHDRPTEGATGGDFGIVVTRPSVREVLNRDSELDVNHDYQRGLLCQAKMFRRNSQWGHLTRTQKRVLPNKLKYFTLLLYRYAEQSGDRRELAPFLWQLTRNSALELVNQWLVSGQFPNTQNSQQVLAALIRDQIGTDDKKIIATDITPPMRPSLEIKIRWKGEGPGGRVHVQNRFSNRVQQHVRLRQ
jgi:hypothetical protein